MKTSLTGPIQEFLLTSTVATGIVYGTGYLVESGYERLLGAELHADVDRLYVLIAGKYFVAVLTQVLQWIGDNPGAFFLFASLSILFLAAYVLARRLSGWSFSLLAPKAHNYSIVSNVIALLVLVAALCEMLYFDWPAIIINQGMLDPEISVQQLDAPYGKSFLHDLVHDKWTSLVCARVRSLDTCGKSREFYQNALRSNYLANLFVTSMVVWLGISVYTARSRWLATHTAESRSSIGARVLGGMVIGAIIIDLILLPFVYGKSLHSTTVKEAKIYLNYPDIETEKRNIREIHGFILADGPSGLTIFEKESYMLWQIPWSEVLLIKVERMRDVVEFNVLRRKHEQDTIPSAVPPS